MGDGSACRLTYSYRTPNHISKTVPSTAHSGPQGGRSQAWGSAVFSYHRPRGPA